MKVEIRGMESFLSFGMEDYFVTPSIVETWTRAVSFLGFFYGVHLLSCGCVGNPVFSSLVVELIAYIQFLQQNRLGLQLLA